MTAPASVELVLVIPCYDEGGRLRPDAFLDFVRTHPTVHLLFVDDGSADDTAAVLERLRQAAPETIAVKRLEVNQGKAVAVRVGIMDGLLRRPALVGFWDADLSTPLDTVDEFLALARDRPDLDIIMGSRVKLMGRDIQRLAVRHYVGRACATAISMTLALPVYDTQCGAKVFRVNEGAAAVFGQPFRSRWIFDVEILARYLALPVRQGDPPRRSRIYELPVPVWHHVGGSKVRWTDYARAAVDLGRIWRERRRLTRHADPPRG